MESNFKFLPFLALLFLFPLSGCKSSSPGLAPKGGDFSSPQRPDLKMTKLRLQYFTDRGLEWELHSPLAKGYSTRNIMETTDMHIWTFQEKEESTQVSADSAIMITEKAKRPGLPLITQNVDGRPLKQGDMYLKGNVVVTSTDGAKLETDWLWFHQKDQFITSTAPVKITRPDSITTGVGLNATSDLSNVTIFNQTVVIKSTESRNEVH